MHGRGHTGLQDMPVLAIENTHISDIGVWPTKNPRKCLYGLERSLTGFNLTEMLRRLFPRPGQIRRLPALEDHSAGAIHRAAAPHRTDWSVQSVHMLT